MDALMRRRIMMMRGVSPGPGPEPPTPGPLPSGYLECDWIASANGSYINTGIYPNPNYSIEITAKLYKYADNGYYTLFGTQTGSVQRFAAQDNNNSTTVRVFRSTAKNNSYYYDLSLNRETRTTWQVVGLYKNVLKVNGETKNTFAESSMTGSFDSPLLLLALQRSSDATQQTGFGYYYIKTCKIWDDSDNLVRDYIPAYEVATAKFGLWDKATETFYGSDNANDFIGNLRDIQLPAGYTQVDFVRFTGAQYVLFNETVKMTDCFEMDWRWTATNVVDARVVCAPDHAFSLYRNGSTKNAFNYGVIGSWVTTGLTCDLAHAYALFDGKNKSLYIDAHATTKTMDLSSYTEVEDKDSWWIGKSTGEDYSKMDVYRFKKYENGVLVHDLIPCINSNNIYGLYDIVGNQFRVSETATMLEGGFIKD